MFWNKFYDRYWNFDNKRFIKLLEDARRAQYKWASKKSGWKDIEITLFQGVNQKELWQFINKFSIFLNSWIDVKWALWILVKQIKNPYLKKIWIEMRDNIDHGIGINETMNQYPKVFDPLTTALVWVWEKTWQLWKILAELDTSLLESIELKWKVKWAMVYPMILLFLTLMMVVFMMVFIVPRISASFAKAGSELPGLTQKVVAFSNFIVHDWWKLLLILISIIGFFKLVNASYMWKIALANIATRMPIFGYVVKQSNIVYFTKAFTILLDSWVLLLDSLKTSSKVVPNLVYKKELIRIKNEVEVWLTISKSLWLNLDYEESVYLNRLFPEEFAYVVSTWEETWSLSTSLKKVWENYNWELKRYIWNMSSMMEPVIIVIVGALVGTIVVAIMMPFFEMWKVAKWV